MFYVSSITYSKSGDKLWGITDTNDNVEEFLSSNQIKEVFDKIGYNSIKGAVFTGSSVKCEVITPIIVYIDELQNGSKFTLNINGEVHNFEKLGITNLGDGWYVTDNGASKKLLKKFLLKNKNNIRLI